MSPLALSIHFLQAQPDSRLVSLAREGHEPAFEALVRRYRKELLSYCRRLQPQTGSAEDALQQTLLQAWTALSAGAEVRDVRRWLYRIAHNVTLNNLRVAVAVPHEILDAAAGNDVHQLVEQRIQARAALAGMASLPTLQRQAFVSTTLNGVSHEDVASTLGLSSGAVRGLIYRARATVRAAAAAFTPTPVVHWAIRRAEIRPGGSRAAVEALAGGGGAGLTVVLAKGGAVLTLAGAVAGAGGVILTNSSAHHHRATVRLSHASAHDQRAQAADELGVGAAAAAIAGERAGGAVHGARSPERSGRNGRTEGGDHSGSGGAERRGTNVNTSGGRDGGSSGGSDGGSSSGSSGSSDGGSTSGVTTASSSGSSDGGSGGTSTTGSTTSGSDGGTSGGALATTTDGGSGSDGGSSGGSGSSGSDGTTTTTTTTTTSGSH